VVAFQVKTLKKVGIISKPSKPELQGIVRDLLQWLAEHGYQAVMDEETATYLSNEYVVSRDRMCQETLEFVVVLGGDGTLISAARCVARSGIPILAVNLGSLGFLTEVPLAEMFATLEDVHKGACPIDSRSVMQCERVHDGKVLGHYFALNEIVVSKTQIARLVTLRLEINGNFVYQTRADGLIVGTPTGSTAYSLSAGGPVMMPHVDAFLVTPVCSHSFTQRPLVTRDDAVVEVVVESEGESCYLSIDGQIGEPLDHEDRIICRKAQHNVKLLRTKRSFFEVLRNKLKWG
jgi:NAD+ kinase